MCVLMLSDGLLFLERGFVGVAMKHDRLGIWKDRRPFFV